MRGSAQRYFRRSRTIRALRSSNFVRRIALLDASSFSRAVAALALWPPSRLPRFLDGRHSDLEFAITLEISRAAAAENPRFHRAQGSHRPHIDRRQPQGSNVAMHSKGDLLWRNK